jgi:hypothetical protein
MKKTLNPFDCIDSVDRHPALGGWTVIVIIIYSIIAFLKKHQKTILILILGAIFSYAIDSLGDYIF